MDRRGRRRSPSPRRGYAMGGPGWGSGPLDFDPRMRGPPPGLPMQHPDWGHPAHWDMGPPPGMRGPPPGFPPPWEQGRPRSRSPPRDFRGGGSGRRGRSPPPRRRSRSPPRRMPSPGRGWGPGPMDPWRGPSGRSPPRMPPPFGPGGWGQGPPGFLRRRSPSPPYHRGPPPGMFGPPGWGVPPGFMDRRGGPEWPDRRGPAGPWGGGRPDGPLDGLGPLPRKKKKRRTGKKRVSGSKRKLLKELKAKEAAEGKGEGEGAAPAKEGGGRGRKKKEAKKDAAAKEGDAAGSGSEEDSESSSDEEMEGAAAKPSPATLSELEVKEVPGEELRALAKDRKAEAWFYLDPQGEVQGPHSVAQMLKWMSFLTDSSSEEHQLAYEQFKSVALYKEGMALRVSLTKLLDSVAKEAA